VWVLQNNLTSASGDCIVIAASGVVLMLNTVSALQRHTISGGGTGAGIHVSRLTALGTPVTDTYIDGVETPIAISGFAAGLLDEGVRTTGYGLTCKNNVDGLLLEGNNGYFSNAEEDFNTNGIHLAAASNQTLGPGMAAFSNTNVGVFLDKSIGNKVKVFTQYSGLSGIQLSPGSDRNRVFSGISSANGTFGIRLDRDAKNNVVTRFNMTNGGTNGTTDASDGNVNCGSNLWFDNTFTPTTPPSSCIH
jgi:hypothetical protein